MFDSMYMCYFEGIFVWRSKTHTLPTHAKDSFALGYFKKRERKLRAQI